MQESLDTPVNSKNPHWLSIIEALSLVGTIGGTVASVVTQQVAYASVPLSLTATLNLINRKRLMDTLTQEHCSAVNTLVSCSREQQASLTNASDNIEVLTQSVTGLKSDQEDLAKQLQENQQLISEDQTSIANLKQEDEALNGSIQSLEQQQTELTELVATLKTFTVSSGSIEAQAQPGQAYYNRGVSQERLGNLEAACFDYSEAISQNSDYAEAYYSRGMVKSLLGDKREAVKDLRLAAKCFFERGDLANYQKARDMGEQIHDLVASESQTTDVEPVPVDGLFS